MRFTQSLSRGRVPLRADIKVATRRYDRRVDLKTKPCFPFKAEGVAIFDIGERLELFTKKLIPMLLEKRAIELDGHDLTFARAEIDRSFCFRIGKEYLLLSTGDSLTTKLHIIGRRLARIPYRDLHRHLGPVIRFDLRRHNKQIGSELAFAILTCVRQRFLGNGKRMVAASCLLVQNSNSSSGGDCGGPATKCRKPALNRTTAPLAPIRSDGEGKGDRDYGEQTNPRQSIYKNSEAPRNHSHTPPPALDITNCHLMASFSPFREAL